MSDQFNSKNLNSTVGSLERKMDYYGWSSSKAQAINGPKLTCYLDEVVLWWYLIYIFISILISIWTVFNTYRLSARFIDKIPEDQMEEVIDTILTKLWYLENRNYIIRCLDKYTGCKTTGPLYRKIRRTIWLMGAIVLDGWTQPEFSLFNMGCTYFPSSFNMKKATLESVIAHLGGNPDFEGQKRELRSRICNLKRDIGYLEAQLVEVEEAGNSFGVEYEFGIGRSRS